MKWLAVAAIVLATLAPSAAAKQQQRPWLWQCAQIGRLDAQWTCYVRLLLADIDRAGNPAAELPRIDRRARESGTALESMCHPLMHEVGRRYGAEHHVTLADLMDYIPRSNDPTCSAGFGMGLVMYLGPQIILTGGRSALAAVPAPADALPLVHLRARDRPRADARLPRAASPVRRGVPQARRAGAGLRAGRVPRLLDLAARRRRHRRRANGASPRFLCNGHLWYVRPCWYRYFVEDATAPLFDEPASIRKACAGLRGLQRYGCVSAAALSIPEDPFAQTRICARLGARRRRVLARRRRAGTRAEPGANSSRSSALCTRMPRGETGDCRSWFGRTLALVTDGRFRCPDRACSAGAALIRKPLVTFS